MTRIVYILVFFLVILHDNGKAQKSVKPNVLFIAIDDLNDWVEPLRGNNQTITPNLNKFCDKGAVIFNNAVCPAPVCGPSRSAILSGFMPNKTGVYGNGTNMIYTDLVKENATLPEYFSKNGYYTLADGKIFHKHATEHGTDFGHWAFDEFSRSRRYVKDNADPKYVTSAKQGIIKGEKSPEFKAKAKLSWGPTKSNFEETVDYRVAKWASDQLKIERDKPFFMGVGFIKPHLPWFVPSEFFDKFDLETIEVPEIYNNDLQDILKPNGQLAFRPTEEYKWIKKHGLEKEATRAYLANINYVDTCLGIVLNALEESGKAENTIVVIWGDHGWHLGEKLRYLKNTLWSEAVKPPFIVRLPKMDEKVYCPAPVNLIDMYPTLINLCGLPSKEIDGHDFSGLLDNPSQKWDYPGITISESGTSVLTERWHYIQYLNGTEEFYDLKNDPKEWNNLVSIKTYRETILKFKKWIPKDRAKAKRIHFPKQKNYVDADADPTLKRNISKLK